MSTLAWLGRVFDVYDRLVRKARRFGRVSDVCEFCRRLEEIVLFDERIDYSALSGLIVDLYDPKLSWRENLNIVVKSLGLPVDREFSEEEVLYSELLQLREMLDYVSEDERDRVLARIRWIEKKLEEASRASRARRVRRRRKRADRVRIRRIIRGKLTLRDYQREALDRWVMNGMRGIIVLPTGTGKTYIAIASIYKTNVPTLILVPTIPLVQQWRRKLEEYGIHAGYCYSGRMKLKKTTVMTYSSAIRRLHLIDRSFKYIIFDEVHHLAAHAYSSLIRILDGKYVMGLTASIKRVDGREHIIVRNLGGIVYRLSIRELSDYVAPIEVHTILVKLSRSERIRYSRLRISLSRIASLLCDDSEYDEAHARALFSVLSLLKRFLSECDSKLSRAVDVISAHADGRVLVFSESISSIERLKSLLEERGIRCETYHSLKTRSERKRILEEWGKTFNILLTVRTLEEGIDVPECSKAVILASGKSDRQVIQRIGRIIRYREGKKSIIYLILAENTLETQLIKKYTLASKR